MAYERKFPTPEKKQQTSKAETPAETTPTMDTESVDRSSRVSLSTTRSATATRRNPDDLTVPEMITEYFKKQGYSLRWVAVVDAGTKSFTNKRVNQFIAIGGDLVTAKEIKQLDSSFLQGMVKYDYREEFADDEDLSRGSQQGIRKGDLILMKLPLDYINSRRQEISDTVNEQIQSSQKEYLKRGLEVKQYKSKTGVQQVSGSFFD
jgi:hypothetical protein